MEARGDNREETESVLLVERPGTAVPQEDGGMYCLGHLGTL